MKRPPSPQALADRFRRTIDGRGLLRPFDTVLLAVSGGADSVVLLDLMLAVRGAFSLTLGVAHLNHALRGPESEADLLFVRELARRHELPFFGEKRDVAAFRQTHKLSLEEAARTVRYEFLFETADRHGYQRIATAHHASDNAELVLMNLMRGSGPSGLSGMAPLSADGRLIRPLLDLTRSDILTHLDARGLAFREDGSNQDRAFLRNRVRLDLLPEIEARYQKGFSRTLVRTARIIQDDEAWMASLIEPLFQGLVLGRTNDSLDLDLPGLIRLPPAARRRIVRRAIEAVKGNVNGMGLVHIDAAAGLITPDGERKSLDLPGRVRILRRRGVLTVKQENRSLRQTRPFDGLEPPGKSSENGTFACETGDDG
ncbi:hypothetical protein JCM14469_27340 [Desulfatiferula olefinivorans]